MVMMLKDVMLYRRNLPGNIAEASHFVPPNTEVRSWSSTQLELRINIDNRGYMQQNCLFMLK